ncbi:MAG: peptidoglycan-binding protein [Pararhodobacter sp.]|nr:peptidoglycan-binding protein [Pararhodobacter sp.]
MNALSNRHLRTALPLVAVLVLAACQSTAPDSTAPDAAATRADTGEAAPVMRGLPGCLASDMVPVVADDAIASDAAAMEERQFAVPCPEQMDADFVASLQRALIVRGYHEGTATGSMDSTTAEAVRRYQRPRGLDSTILSLDAARSLGLVAVGRGG